MLSYQFIEYIAKVAVRIEISGRAGNGFCYQLNGIIRFAHLKAYYTKQMQSDGLVWVGMQYLLVDVGGLGQAACIEVLPGGGKGLLDVDSVFSLMGLEQLTIGE